MATLEFVFRYLSIATGNLVYEIKDNDTPPSGPDVTPGSATLIRAPLEPDSQTVYGTGAYIDFTNADTVLGIGPFHTLGSHSDVTISTTADNDILQYNNATQQWENATLDAAIGNDICQILTDNADLNCLRDVNAVSTSGNVLYASSTGLWKSDGLGNLLTANGISIDTLGDVSITGVTGGEILQWDGTAWTNKTVCEVLGTSGVSLTCMADVFQNPSGISAGDILQWTGTGWTNVNQNQAISQDIQTVTITNQSYTPAAPGGTAFYADIPGLSLTSVQNDNFYALSFNGNFEFANANSMVFIRLTVDGTALQTSEREQTIPGANDPFIASTLDGTTTRLTSGTNIRVQWTASTNKQIIMRAGTLFIRGIP